MNQAMIVQLCRFVGLKLRLPTASEMFDVLRRLKMPQWSCRFKAEHTAVPLHAK